jgi:hypothetical protein
LPARLDIVPEKETENLQLHLRNNSDKNNLKDLKQNGRQKSAEKNTKSHNNLTNLFFR